MARVLITGGAGFIGSHYVRHALTAHADWQVTVLDKLTYAGNPANLEDLKDHPRYRFVRGDIASRKDVDAAMGAGSTTCSISPRRRTSTARSVTRRGSSAPMSTGPTPCSRRPARAGRRPSCRSPP